MAINLKKIDAKINALLDKPSFVADFEHWFDGKKVRKMANKNKHGGARKGAGRKRAPYKVRAVKVPEPILEKVRQIIKEFKKPSN